MKSFLQSSATKALLLTLAGQLLFDLIPMLRAHAIDVWALAEGQAVLVAALVANALRPDVDVPGLNWLGPRK